MTANALAGPSALEALMAAEAIADLNVCDVMLWWEAVAIHKKDMVLRMPLDKACVSKHRSWSNPRLIEFREPAARSM